MKASMCAVLAIVGTLGSAHAQVQIDDAAVCQHVTEAYPTDDAFVVTYGYGTHCGTKRSSAPTYFRLRDLNDVQWLATHRPMHAGYDAEGEVGREVRLGD